MNLLIKLVYLLKKVLFKALPNSWKERLLGIFRKHVNNPDFQTFGQFGEDAFVRKRLAVKGIKNGFYIDVGAYSPIALSNTYVLYRSGWHGIIVDISPETIQQFINIRPNDISVQKGISKEEGTAIFYSWGQSAFNTISEDVAKEINEEATKITVETTTLANLISEYVPDNLAVDFLNVDVEGHDLVVLQSNDWKKYRPILVCVEDHDFSNNYFQSEIRTYMEQQEYSLISWIAPNLIFEDKTK